MNVYFNDIEYEIPEDEYERFSYLKRKISFAQENNWVEMFRGYTVVLKAEFKKYKVKK